MTREPKRKTRSKAFTKVLTFVTSNRAKTRMNGITHSSWQRIDDPPNDEDKFDLLPREENQKRPNNPPNRGHHQDFNQGSRSATDRVFKLTPRTEGMSRQAVISMLYGYLRCPTKDEINNDKKETCPSSHSRYHKGKHGATSEIDKNKGIGQYTPLKHKAQFLDKKFPLPPTPPHVLDKKLPLPPTPPHRVGGLKWKEEQMAKAAGKSLDPKDQTVSRHDQALHYLERSRFRIAGLASQQRKEQYKARKTLGIDLVPENPFDDYFALSYIEERALTRGDGALLP